MDEREEEEETDDLAAGGEAPSRERNARAGENRWRLGQGGG
jgi:hypothetical protein